jgi:hypothetical protein
MGTILWICCLILFFYGLIELLCPSSDCSCDCNYEDEAEENSERMDLYSDYASKDYENEHICELHLNKDNVCLICGKIISKNFL